MTNPFKKKVYAVTFHAKGYNRQFEIITADGSNFYTEREDYLNVSDYFKSVSKIKILSKNLMGHDYIEVENGVKVVPIIVRPLEIKEIDLIETFSTTYFINKPQFTVEYGITMEITAQ